MSSSYDDVPYDSEANRETHPGSIATVARLFGGAPAPPSRCRVLEIGCGNGENLIAAATYLPDARFVGFDLAATAIAAGRAAAPSNVRLEAKDLREVRAAGGVALGEAPFDYVIAHGMYSWVPETVRADLLEVMRASLSLDGVGFLSLHLLPGGALRRALREIARDRTAAVDEPAAKVAAALALIADIGRAGKNGDGYFGELAAAARAYEEHVARATPPDAPFSRYVFHDLLAEYSEPFSVDGLEGHLAQAGLAILSETPLLPARAADFGGLASEVARARTPFIQVLVERADGRRRTLDPSVVRDLLLWADLAPAAGGALRTSRGAIVRATSGGGLARAAAHFPGFVVVGDLADDDATRDVFAAQVFAGFCDGVFTLRTEAPPCVTAPSERPRVAPHVRARAEAAAARLAASAALTNALHDGYRLPWSELAVVRLLDGRRTAAEIAAAAAEAAREVPSSLSGPLDDAARAERFVRDVVDRLRRHLFLVADDA